MTDHVFTPVEVENEIMRLTRALDEATSEIAERGETQAHAKVTYQVAFAKAHLVAPGKTVDERKAHAVLSTADEYLASELADKSLVAAQEKSRNARTQLDALRTVSASVRGQA